MAKDNQSRWDKDMANQDKDMANHNMSNLDNNRLLLEDKILTHINNLSEDKNLTTKMSTYHLDTTNLSM